MRFRRQTLEWESQNHDDEPRDQLTDLTGPFWASVGPDEREAEDGWSWTIMDFDQDSAGVAFGFSESEDAAKRAVAKWARDNRRMMQAARAT